MIPIPPMLAPSPPRGLAAGRWLAALAALATVFACGACEANPAENRAGLIVAANGTIGVTDAEGRVQPIEGPSGAVRRVSASNGRIAAETDDQQFFVANAPRAGEARSWSPLTFEGPSNRTPSGMDLSPDGRTLALVLGDPDTAGLELITLDVESGRNELRAIDLMSNGGPSWLGPQLLALEVIRSDQHAGIATVDPTTGEVVVTDARGFAPSATRDGTRIAVLDATTDVVAVMDPTDWLAGVAGDDPGIVPPKESSVQDVAISADGTRLAIVYVASSGTASSIVMLRLSGAAWESESSIQVPGDGAVSIDWLD